MSEPTWPSRFIFSHSSAQRRIACRDARGSVGGGTERSSGGNAAGGESGGGSGLLGSGEIGGGSLGAAAGGGRFAGRRGGVGTAPGGAACLARPLLATPLETSRLFFCCCAGCAPAPNDAAAIQRQAAQNGIVRPAVACRFALAARLLWWRMAQSSSMSVWGTKNIR